jgi:hypothetical protein
MKHNDVIKVLSRFTEIKSFLKETINWYYTENVYKTIAWVKHNNEIVRYIRVYNDINIEPTKNLPIYNCLVFEVTLNEDKLINAIDNFLSISAYKKVHKYEIDIQTESTKLKIMSDIILRKFPYLHILKLDNIDFGMIYNFLNNKIDSGIFLDYLKEYYPEIEKFIS